MNVLTLVQYIKEIQSLRSRLSGMKLPEKVLYLPYSTRIVSFTSYVPSDTILSVILVTGSINCHSVVFSRKRRQSTTIHEGVSLHGIYDVPHTFVTDTKMCSDGQREERGLGKDNIINNRYDDKLEGTSK